MNADELRLDEIERDIDRRSRLMQWLSVALVLLSLATVVLEVLLGKWHEVFMWALIAFNWWLFRCRERDLIRQRLELRQEGIKAAREVMRQANWPSEFPFKLQ